jgi:hypothetical protein
MLILIIESITHILINEFIFGYHNDFSFYLSVIHINHEFILIYVVNFNSQLYRNFYHF